jgi:hypothetical protein
MYNVILVNLSADARSVAAHSHVEQRDLGNDALRTLLGNFCEIDPIENAAAEAEIRVQVRHESYLIRTGQKKLIIYDTRNRELPGQIFTVEQVMNELDGSAAAARNQAIMLARAEADPGETATMVPVVAAPAANKPRLAGLVIIAGLLLGAILYLAAPSVAEAPPAEFTAVENTEAAGLQASLTGVYLTGNEPGQHGIVVTGPGELKLFELDAVEAPRVVYAGYKLGRVGPKLCLATDQPGGIIEITAEGALLYCGELYQRIP